jgi:hypothetical protein
MMKEWGVSVGTASQLGMASDVRFMENVMNFLF